MSKKTIEYAKKLVSQMTIDEKISQMLYESPAIEDWGYRNTTGGMRLFME